MNAATPLIVSLKLDAQSFAALNALRQTHFPPERNFLPAHLTLFHALPDAQEIAVRATLAAACAETPALGLLFPRLRSLGRGVAVEVDAPELIALRRQLAAAWTDWLTPQDRQGFRPHVTIQNKVAPDEARQLYGQLAPAWHLDDGRGEGVLLWRYLGGPWELVEEFSFGGEERGQDSQG